MKNVEAFNCTFNSSITDIRILANDCLYNPATGEVNLNIIIWSNNVLIPQTYPTPTAFAFTPEKYRPKYNQIRYCYTVLDNINQSVEMVEVYNTGNICLLYQIRNENRRGLFLMVSYYI